VQRRHSSLVFRLPPTKSKHKVLWILLIAIGGLSLVLILLSVIGSHSVGPPSSSEGPPSKLQAALTSALQEELSENKQQLYEKTHVAGELSTAKKDVIQSVSCQWRGGRPTDDAADLVSFTVDHTLYWETPLTKDGYTKFSDTYDWSNGTSHVTDSKIIATNGITVEGATKAMVDYGAKELTKAITDWFNGTPAPSPAP
jgi:hypothetical protein